MTEIKITDPRELREELAVILRSRHALTTSTMLDDVLLAAGYDRPADMSWSNWLADVIVTGLAYRDQS